MKIILILNLLVASIFFSLTDNKNCSTDATIIGKDISKCYCCWGWQVKIGDKVYLTEKIPQLGLEMDDEWPFEDPMAVKIEYEVLEEGCDNKITILCLEEVQNEH